MVKNVNHRLKRHLCLLILQTTWTRRTLNDRIMVISRKNPQNSHIWILKGFNLPDINWTNESPPDTCRFKDLYDNFTENIINHNLKQMVKIPSRNKNILISHQHTKSSSWNQNVTRIRHIRSQYSISRNQCQTGSHQAKPQTGQIIQEG